MKVVKIDYVQEIYKLTKHQRNELIISIATNGRVLSYYSSDIWDFTYLIYIKSRTKRQNIIDFSSLKFSDGSCLTDPQYDFLLDSVKSFLYTRMAVVDNFKGKTAKASTIIHYWNASVRQLLRWMVEVGYRSFNELTSERCLAYVAYCKNSDCRRYDLIERPTKQLSSSSLFSRFALLESMWTFREYLPFPLPEHPWPNHRGALSLAGLSRTGGIDTSTEQIPDRLMVKLITGALNYVTSGYGEHLLDCRDALNNWSPIDSFLADYGLNHKDFLAEITRLLTACYVIINAFSGMRISEVISLKIDCYYENTGWDGSIYGWLKGTTFKLDEEPMPGQWMVPPVVKQAVMIATRATYQLREQMENRISELTVKLKDSIYINKPTFNDDSDLLAELIRHRNCLFIVGTKSSSIRTFSDSSLKFRLKNFARHINLMVKSSDLDQVRNRTKITDGNIWPLTTHQFRKTFSRYVARCILGDVRYLKEHFKHWSLDMTLGYAWNEDDLVDPTLIEDVLTEHQEMQSDIVRGWIDINRDQHLAGVGGENIQKARERTKTLVATDPHAVARQLSKGYFLRGLGHSWCTEKECRGKGIYSITECKTCENRVIDESNIPYWQNIRLQQIELLHIDDCGDPMWQGAVDSLRYAESILKLLGFDADPYPIPAKPSARRVCA
jgi:integrase